MRPTAYFHLLIKNMLTCTIDNHLHWIPTWHVALADSQWIPDYLNDLARFVANSCLARILHM